MTRVVYLWLAIANIAGVLALFGFHRDAENAEFQDIFNKRGPESLNHVHPGLEDLFILKNSSSILDARSLFGRQTCRSDSPKYCGNGCCGTSEKCCPDSCCPDGAGECCPAPMGGCCPSTANCVPSLDKCCPKTSETCGGKSCFQGGAVCCEGGTTGCRPGETCCSNGCCESGWSCCNNERCCSRGTKCCPGVCCPSGSDCGDSYGQCQRTTTSRTSTTTSSTSSSTTSSPNTTPKIQTPKIPSASATATDTSAECKHVAATGMPQPTSSDLPVMEFVYISPFVAPNIPINVCLGIRHKLGRSAQEIVLTYAGNGLDCAHLRGRSSGCRGCCKDVIKSTGAEAGRRTECDKFPFKSTVKGGNGAWVRCVTAWENQLQGYYLNSWYKDNDIKPDNQFIVRVSNLDCSTVQPSDLQTCSGGGLGTQQIKAEPLASGSETAVRRTLDNKTNVVVAAFGDLDGMGYEANARLVTGRLAQGRIIDSDGYEVSAMSDDHLDSLSSKDGLTVKWKFDDYVGGIGFIGETQSTVINFTWKLLPDLSGPDSESGSADRGGWITSSLLAIMLWAIVVLCVVG